MANALINLFNRGKEALIGRPEQIIPSTEYSGAYQPLVSQVDFINQNLSTLPQNEQDLWNQQGYENIRKNAALGDTSNIPSLQNASDNMGLRGGLNVVPATKGFLSDVQSGFRENANTPFSVENLAQPSRGKAFRLGEGLGTLGRAASSSVGRGLGTAALVGALGGDTLDMIAAGGQVALRNQQAKTQDQLYRKALEEQGLDTSKIRGYINENIYKNYSLGNYRTRGLDIKEQTLQHKVFIDSVKDNNDKAKMISTLLNNGSMSPAEARAHLNNYGIPIESLDTSNQTRNAIINANESESRIYRNYMMPQVALGQLGLGQARYGLDVEKFETQKEKEAQGGGMKSLGEQINQFETMLNLMPTDVSTPMSRSAGGSVAKALGVQSPEQAQFEAERAMLLSQIARKLQGERGVLTDQDVKRVEDAIPNWGDSVQTRQEKMKILKANYGLVSGKQPQYAPTSGQQSTTPAQKTPQQLALEELKRRGRL